MPAATANAPNLTGYFKLDGSRNITGPTNIYNNVGQLASDVLTVRGAAGQTGDLLVLQNNTPANLVKWYADGRMETAFTLTGGASRRHGRSDTFTLDASAGQSLSGYLLTSTLASGKTLDAWYGIDIESTLTGKSDLTYNLYSSVSSASASAQSELYSIYGAVNYSGAGLLGYLVGEYMFTQATGPVTSHSGFWVDAFTTGATGQGYGAQITVTNQGSTTTSTTGLRVAATNSGGGSTPILTALDLSVTGSGTSTYALKSTGGSFLVTGPTLSSSSAVSLLSLAQTWNTSGTPTALLVNVTNTASNANSKLIDLQAGGTSRFNVLATGNMGLEGNTAPASPISFNTTFAAVASTPNKISLYPGTSYGFGLSSNMLNIQTSGSIGFYSGTTLRASMISSGLWAFGGSHTPTATIDVNSDIIRLRTAKTPASASATGNAGDICWDSSFIYVCVSASSWKRVAISSW